MATDPVMRITPPYTPELLPSAQKAVVEFLAQHNTIYHCRPVVLEFGAGWSTLWFVCLGASVLSVEHDPDWAREVGRALRDDLVPLRPEYADRYVLCMAHPDHLAVGAACLGMRMFDLIYVDCLDSQRLPCLQRSLSWLRLGGMLILDDTHWEILEPAVQLLEAWPRTVLDGDHKRKTGQTHYHHTTLFRRPR